MMMSYSSGCVDDGDDLFDRIKTIVTGLYSPSHIVSRNPDYFYDTVDHFSYRRMANGDVMCTEHQVWHACGFDRVVSTHVFENIDQFNLFVDFILNFERGCHCYELDY